jgi:hypothetical protein
MKCAKKEELKKCMKDLYLMLTMIFSGYVTERIILCVVFKAQHGRDDHIECIRAELAKKLEEEKLHLKEHPSNKKAQICDLQERTYRSCR